MATSRTQAFHFRVFDGNKVIAHYRCTKASLPQAVAAFRKWFNDWQEPANTYRITASTMQTPDVWEWVSLNTDKRS
jgi:hypothetical protein